MTSGGDLSNDDKTPGLKDGTNVLFNNPWTFLPAGSTADRPAPSSEINYRLRFNTDDQLYEYYDAILAAWTQLQESLFTVGPFVTYTANASLPDAQNLGALATGLLRQTVTAGVADLDIAVNGTDYYGPGFVIPPEDGGTGVNNGSKTINLGSPTTGYVLTSDASGNGTWQAVGSSGAITTINGNSGSASPVAGVVTINGGTTGLTTLGSGATLSITGTLVASNGGTGLSSLVAFTLLAGGTTSSGAMQQVSAGLSGQLMQSNGPGVLPSWTTATFPAGSGTLNHLLRSDGTNWVETTATTLDASDVLSGLTQLNVDNLRLDGNNLSSTDTNGNISIIPNGAGSTLFGGTTSFATAIIQAQRAGNATIANGAWGVGFGANFNGFHSRGASIGTFDALQNGDNIVQFNGLGSDGAAFQTAGRIQIAVSGSVSSGIVPGQMLFQTANTSGSLATAISISNSQVVGMGNMTFSTNTIATTSGNLILSPTTAIVSTGNLTFATNTIATTSGNLIINPVTTSNITYPDNGSSFRFFFMDTNASTQGLGMQAGTGSSAGGGALLLYGTNHATFAGWSKLTFRGASSGKFAVNNGAIGGGTDVFTVDNSGNIVGTGSLTVSQTAGIIGTTTNNNANAGSVGELNSTVVLAASSVSLTTATPANVVILVLQPGDYNVDAELWFTANVATIIASVDAGLNTTSATIPTVPATGTARNLMPITLGAGLSPIMNFKTCRISVATATTTTVYLVVNASFSVNTLSAYGVIQARRAR